MIRGSQQYRLLIISNDEYNELDEVRPWGAAVIRGKADSELLVQLSADDPLSGAMVDVTRVMQIDRTALRDNHGFVSNTTLNSVEYALREFLNLP
jgi:mRNA interferase MazF